MLAGCVAGDPRQPAAASAESAWSPMPVVAQMAEGAVLVDEGGGLHLTARNTLVHSGVRQPMQNAPPSESRTAGLRRRPHCAHSWTTCGSTR